MKEEVQAAVEDLLEALGVEESPHLTETPRRVAETLWQLTNPEEFKFTTFENKDISQMVVMQDIPFYSLCAHHILPFFGKAHIGYIPDGQIVGISKLARTVEFFSRGLNVQEELTQDIHTFLDEKLEPKGVAVVLKAEHLCLAMRGAQKPGHLTTTSALSGVFLDDKNNARAEFLGLLR